MACSIQHKQCDLFSQAKHNPPLAPPPSPSPPSIQAVAYRGADLNQTMINELDASELVRRSLDASERWHLGSWPGAEDLLVLDDEWASVAPSSEIPSAMASFVADEWERTSLVETNNRLKNQVEVLLALAGRPSSDLASRCSHRSLLIYPRSATDCHDLCEITRFPLISGVLRRFKKRQGAMWQKERSGPQ